MIEEQYVPPQTAQPPFRCSDAWGERTFADPPERDASRSARKKSQKCVCSGENKALVVSATGTGKTILAALDVKAVNPKRVLFVVHRQQILDRAIEEFSKVLNLTSADIGKFVGARKELDRRFVFADSPIPRHTG